MEPILTTVVSALIAEAISKAHHVGSGIVMDTYEALKGLRLRKLGRSRAIRGVEDDPE